MRRFKVLNGKGEHVGDGVEWISFGECTTLLHNGEFIPHWRTVTDIHCDGQSYEFIDPDDADDIAIVILGRRFVAHRDSFRLVNRVALRCANWRLNACLRVVEDREDYAFLSKLFGYPGLGFEVVAQAPMLGRGVFAGQAELKELRIDDEGIKIQLAGAGARPQFIGADQKP